MFRGLVLILNVKINIIFGSELSERCLDFRLSVGLLGEELGLLLGLGWVIIRIFLEVVIYVFVI